MIHRHDREHRVVEKRAQKYMQVDRGGSGSGQGDGGGNGLGRMKADGHVSRFGYRY